MQWNKMKNALLLVLLIANLCVIGILLVPLLQQQRRQKALRQNLGTLLQRNQVQLAADFSLAEDCSLPVLWVERSRAAEQQAAAALLHTEQGQEQADGSSRYENQNGWLCWLPDGRLNAKRIGVSLPDDPAAYAKSLLSEMGLLADTFTFDAAKGTVRISQDSASQPIFERTILLRFAEDALYLSGHWSFGTPFTGAGTKSIFCAASDALYRFSDALSLPCTVLSMQSGYAMLEQDSTRLRLAPCWKISTDKGDYLISCTENTVFPIL